CHAVRAEPGPPHWGLTGASRLRPQTPKSSMSRLPALPRWDVIVVGGGPAGLSAALVLGRCRRRVLVCDVGRPRNARARALHGFLTRDGTRPARLLDIARAQLRPYPNVALLPVEVTAVCTAPGGFEATLAGGRKVRARFVLMATGVVDQLPSVPGL